MMQRRIVQIRRDAGLSQEELAKRLDITANYVWMIEKGQRFPSERLIKAICREFDVNETWLRTGEGDPYIKQGREDQLTAAVNRLLSGENPEFRRRLVMVLSSLDDEQWGFLEAKLLEIIGDRQNPAPVPAEPVETPDAMEENVPLSEEEIEEKVAAYRALLKKGRAVRLALGHDTTPQTKASGDTFGSGTGGGGELE